MAFIHCIKVGGTSLDLTNPDAQTAINSATTSSTTNISVTKKPRYIVVMIWDRSGSNYNFMLGIVDVAKSTGKRCGYLSAGATSWTTWTGYVDYFPAITSSAVAYSGSTWGRNHRVHILIYY